MKLLNREERNIDLTDACIFLKGKKIVVTGAAGSIGSEICRQLISMGLEVLALDNAETPLHNLCLELPTVQPMLNDIRTHDGSYDVCFHAAAYKHVGMLQMFPDVAYDVNVSGTLNMMRKSKDFILISTDKAAQPKCVMGQTKRYAENDVITFGQKFVRFGNVLGSNGSVLKIWEKQISEGHNLTITDKDATRYFMTIPEAAKFVIATIAMPAGGYLLDMGESVSIYNLANRFIELSGEKVDIDYIGLKDGEKLHEVLHSQLETLEETGVKGILKLKTTCTKKH
jgi:FlaA1/EpsC-like NDP-sugar epimerase